jgi:AraC-like DNA-binding protein
MMLGKVEFHAVYIDPHFGHLPGDKCCVVQMSSLMRQLIQNLAEDAPDGGRRHTLIMSLLLEEMKSVRPLSLGLQLPADRRLAVICNALMEDPSSPWSLAEWASWAGASERTLARLFQTELATSFGVWRQQVRLAKAVDLMSRGVSVTDIAAELGYANVGAFSSMFKRTLGVPPSQFNSSLQSHLPPTQLG